MMQKKIATLLLLTFSLAICGLAFLEFAYRLRSKLIVKDDRTQYARLPLDDDEHHFCKGPKDRVVTDRDREFIERPNAEYFEYRDGEAKLHSYNEYGYRINEKSWSKRADIKKIWPSVWVFGDSFTRGSLADNTETIPALLTKMNLGQIYFINFGIGGYGYLNSLKTLQWAQSHLPNKPMAILFIGHANDIADDRRTERRLKIIAESTALDSTPLGKGKEATLHSQQTDGAGRSALESFPWLASRWQSLVWLKTSLLDRAKTTTSSAEYKTSLRNSEAFFRLAKSITPNVYAFFVPSLYPDQYQSPDKQDTLNIQLLTISSRQTNVPFLNLSHDVMLSISKTFQSPIIAVADLYGRLDSHLNESGYLTASLAIARQLERLQSMHFLQASQPVNSTNYSIEMQRCPK